MLNESERLSERLLVAVVELDVIGGGGVGLKPDALAHNERDGLGLSLADCLRRFFSTLATMQNLVGGHIDLAGPNPSEMLAQWKGGLARPLAVSAPERVAIMPDVPTLKERGIDVVHRMMRGVALPGEAPAEAVRYWEAALAKETGAAGS